MSVKCRTNSNKIPLRGSLEKDETNETTKKNIGVGGVYRAEAGALGGDDGVLPGGTVLVGRDGWFR